MPPKRRTSMPGAAARNQQAQSTLSFHKQGPNRITKPGAKDRSTKKKDPALLDIAVADVNVDNSVSELDLEQPTTAEAAIAEQTVSVEAELATQKHASVKTGDVLGGRAETSGDEAVVSDVTAAPLSNEETKAMKISDAQIKKYWQSKERERKAPRVHQEGLTIREKLLREWDMSGQYGVSHDLYELRPIGRIRD